MYMLNRHHRNIPSDPNNEGQSSLGGNVEVSNLLRLPVKSDLVPLLLPVSLDVFFGALEDFRFLLALGLAY